MCHGKGCCGAIVLILGILLLIKDVTAWEFWGITPWTLVFLLVGLCVVCRGVCKAPAKKGKKK